MFRAVQTTLLSRLSLINAVFPGPLMGVVMKKDVSAKIEETLGS
jgi:hypothetical protein